LIVGVSWVALFCFGLSLAPTIAATGLIGSGAVGKRAAKQKPLPDVDVLILWGTGEKTG